MTKHITSTSLYLSFILSRKMPSLQTRASTCYSRGEREEEEELQGEREDVGGASKEGANYI
jgi:hypothetical protein